MQWLRQNCKLNKVCVIIACIHWLIGFWTDKLIFQYVIWDFSNLLQTTKTIITFGCKAVFLILLIGLWHGLFSFFKKADRTFVGFVLIYAFFNLFFLFLTWPGIWRMDEFGILSGALRIQPLFWQNYLTSIFYIFSVMLFPFPSGVIIVQIVCNALVVGYLLRQTMLLLKEREKQPGAIIYLGFLPFFMLPVLDSNLYPMRMSVYAFLELLLLFILYRFRGKRAGRTHMWAIALLGAVVTVWRTEAIYYIVAVPVLILVLYADDWKAKEKAQAIFLYLAVTVLLFVPQQLGSRILDGNEYDLTSVVLPLVPLVEEGVKHEDAAGLLADIDRVINVEEAVRGAEEGKSGISLYWGNADFKRDYSARDYRQFKSAYYRLVLKYPHVFLRERWESFLQSDGLLENTTEIFTKDGVANYETFRTYPLTAPVSDKLRTSVIEMLEWRAQGDYKEKRAGYRLIYSAILPILILCAVALGLLCKKKWQYALLLLTPLFKVALIFLTAPSRLFMYYYSVYLIGYSVLVFMIVMYIGKGCENGKHP